MTWTSPMTAVAGSVFTAAQFNQSVRDNLNETGPAKISAAGQILVGAGLNSLVSRTISQVAVDTSQTTTSTSYVDLATAGPAITATTGVNAIVILQGSVSCSSAGNLASMGYLVSGSSSVAASINRSIASNNQQAAGVFFHADLTPGSNTFTAKYLTIAGTGTFQNRRLILVPM